MTDTAVHDPRIRVPDPVQMNIRIARADLEKVREAAALEDRSASQWARKKLREAANLQLAEAALQYEAMKQAAL